MELSNVNRLILDSIYPGVGSDPVDLSQVNFFRELNLKTLSECYRLGGKKLNEVYHDTICYNNADTWYPEQV